MPPKTAKASKKPNQVGEPKPARGPGRSSNLPEDVPTLLKMLGETEDQKTKRNIRARLRAKGHRGGLGRRGRPKKDGATAAPKANKASKKSAPVEETEEE